MVEIHKTDNSDNLFIRQNEIELSYEADILRKYFSDRNKQTVTIWRKFENIDSGTLLNLATMTKKYI